MSSVLYISGDRSIDLPLSMWQNDSAWGMCMVYFHEFTVGERFYRAMWCIIAVFAVMQVCLSVRPSVCTSRSWITSKRINMSSKFFHHRVATPFYFFLPKGCLYSDGNPPNGGVECKGGMKNPAFRPLFSPISRSISETVIVRGASPGETKMW